MEITRCEVGSVWWLVQNLPLMQRVVTLLFGRPCEFDFMNLPDACDSHTDTSDSHVCQHRTHQDNRRERLQRLSRKAPYFYHVFFYALVFAKNNLWVRPCQSVVYFITLLHQRPSYCHSNDLLLLQQLHWIPLLPLPFLHLLFC